MPALLARMPQHHDQHDQETDPGDVERPKHHCSQKDSGDADRPAIQEATLRGLGLGKIGRQKTLEDTKAVRGMIAAVQHLVQVVE